MAQGIKYQPYKYQESYVPMEVIPAVDQALGYQQQRYDTTEGQLSNMYKDLYDRQIYDPQAFNEEMEAIKSKVEDIDKQYKGDLSAGMNDYIRLIGKAKQSPFWKTNELLNKKLEQQNELLARYGPSALKFQTLPTSATKVDEVTGQKRYLRPDEITFDIQSQLDYTEQQGKLWDKALHEESTKGKLPTEMLGKTPFIEIAKGRGITNTQVLNKAAYILNQYKNTDEYKQQKRSLMSLQGLSNEAAEKAIAEDILDTGKSRRYYSDDSQIVHDTQYGKTKAEPADIYVFGQPAQDVEESTFLQEQSSLVKALDRPGLFTGNYNLTEDIKALKDKISINERYIASPPKTPSKIMNVVGSNVQDYAKTELTRQKEELNTLQEVRRILDQNRDIFRKKIGRNPQDDLELAKFIDADSEAVKKEYTVTRPILNPLTSKMLKKTVKEMQSPNFRIGNKDIAARALSDIADRLDVPEAVIRATLDSPEYDPRYNKTTGEYYLNIPTKATINKAGNLSLGEKTSYKRLYFSPDSFTAEYSTGLKQIRDAISSQTNSEIVIAPTRDEFYYVYKPQYKGDRSDKTVPRIEVFDRRTNQSFLDRNGNPVVLSLNDFEDHIEKLNEKNLKSEYTYKWLSLTQQNKAEF